MKEESSSLRPPTQRGVENLRATDLSLDEVDMTRMRALDRNQRFVMPSWVFLPGETETQFWDSEDDDNLVIRDVHKRVAHAHHKRFRILYTSPPHFLQGRFVRVFRQWQYL